jgi:hypothetical protein
MSLTCETKKINGGNFFFFFEEAAFSILITLVRPQSAVSVTVVTAAYKRNIATYNPWHSYQNELVNIY